MIASSVPPPNSMSRSQAVYHLRHHRWRSLLTLLGPLGVLAFYTYICVYYVQRPPINDVVPHVHLDGNWIYYIWFLLSILMLEWAKAGLANVEAAALMHAKFAPASAVQLMWHIDGNWANPLWWVRALRSILSILSYRVSKRARAPPSTPGKLWMLLSLVMLALYVAIPLSGVSIQTAQVLTKSGDLAPIYGPSRDRFGFSAGAGHGSWRTIPQNIRAAWQSGRQTSPNYGFLYSPSEASSASSNYYQDQISLGVSSVEVFVAPAVREQVVGNIWGLWNNVSCRPIRAQDLQLIRINDLNNHTMDSFVLNDSTSIKTCSTYSLGDCEYEWIPISQAVPPVPGGADKRPITFPTFLNESGSFAADYGLHDMILAADGFNGATLRSHSPFYAEGNHDNFTFDHFNGRSRAEATTAMIEIWIWEARLGNDPYLENLSKSASETNDSGVVHVLPSDLLDFSGYIRTLPWAGFGVHCNITSMTGTASIDPAYRRFSNFSAQPANATFDNSIYEPSSSAIDPRLWPPQIQALAALSSNLGQCIGDTTAVSSDICTGEGESDSLWIAIQQSVGRQKFNLKLSADEGGDTYYVYPMLTPEDLTLSMYKLLGESIIAIMDLENGDGPHYEDLSTLRTATYIVAGPISWKFVLAFLALWAFAMFISALWMLFLAGPRWASTLNGFEMFKFGARYPDQVDEFETVEFQECTEVLQRIPGTIGLLPGERRDLESDPRYLIGLSEIPVDSDLQNTRTRFTFDRKEAVTGRSI